MPEIATHIQTLEEKGTFIWFRQYLAHQAKLSLKTTLYFIDQSVKWLLLVQVLSPRLFCIERGVVPPG